MIFQLKHQASKNPPILSAVRNKCFYKALYKLDEPDEESIKKSFKEFKKCLNTFDKLFLKGGPFLGGSTAITVGDLLAANTLEQVSYRGLLSNILNDYI